ncbi:hypothetical protein [Labrys sp. ZIDIC5]|uniref:hypothetical protein n=1 Tax=Labrys sedimenti TaxID=3106036 RepID=UPI002ACA0E68|nr:hypothetical protein [Labrys sp. ZIDIC5]MDZ5448632.1 hypothetical protein [Labrys sp. ZIDIC5]
MIRFLAIILALFATSAYAQYGTPNLQIDKSGSTRCLYVSDLNNTTGADKARPFGCIDGNGAWNYPANLRNLKDIDELALRGRGFIGDGASHPLSGITSLNGRSTVGWTLSQWQAVLPSAAALSDEIDWAVVQSFLDAAGSNAIRIKFGPGTAVFNKPLKTCLQAAIRLDGAGWNSTILQTSGANNGWEHCRGASDPLMSNRIEAHNLAFKRPSPYASNSKVAVTARFRPQSNVHFDHVQIDGYDNGMALENAAGSTFNYVIATSQGPAGAAQLGTGFDLQGGPHTDAGTGQAVGGSFINHITNSRMQGFELGYRFYALGAGLEDIRVTNSAAGGVRRGLQITGNMTGGGNYSPFEIGIDNFSCDATTTCLDIDRGWHTLVRGGDFLLSPAIAATTWNGTGADFITLCRANTVNIRDAFISNNAQAIPIKSMLHVKSDNACGLTGPINPLVSQITNNTFEIGNLTPSDAVVAVDSGAAGILVKDNVFTSTFVPIEPPAGTYRWSTTDNNSALFYNTNVGFLAANAPAAAARTNLTAFNAASLSLPPGRWQCQGNVRYVGSGSSTLNVAQGGLSTTSLSIPSNGTGGGFKYSFTQGTDQENIYNTGTVVFDWTASTTIYLVGVGAWSGGTQTANGNLQCVRLR